MAHVVAADVVVPLEVAVVFAEIPVLRGDHPVGQPAVVQYRQIEPSAVPGYELRRVALDAVEEPLDELPFRLLRLTQRPDTEVVAIPEDAGDDDDLVEVVLEKIRPGLLAPRTKSRFGDFGIRQGRLEFPQTAQGSDVRYGLYVEDEDGIHGSAWRQRPRFYIPAQGLPRVRPTAPGIFSCAVALMHVR